MASGRHPRSEPFRHAKKAARKSGHPFGSAANHRAYRDAYAAFHAANPPGDDERAALDDYLAHMGRVVVMHEEAEALMAEDAAARRAFLAGRGMPAGDWTDDQVRRMTPGLVFAAEAIEAGKLVTIRNDGRAYRRRRGDRPNATRRFDPLLAAEDAGKGDLMKFVPVEGPAEEGDW